MRYLCTTCGAAAETPGHLCSPCDVFSAGILCTKSDANTGFACGNKPAAHQFVCRTCGRKAEEQNQLCNPEPVGE